ncbi:MAG: DUF72 domain-containing protein [Chitinispirillaceae bacterium]|nr:DUF72 domain-containing protein [Chitinispirillaceae bacterium]
MNKIRFGTSGYSYKDWEGVLYPAGTPSTEYLHLYAQEFDVAELNFSYYRMPDAALSRRMVACTGKDFFFSIKGHKTLTHEGSADTVNREVATFLRGIAPIADAGKLGVVLLQFPFSFHYTDENRTYVHTLCGLFGKLPLAIELRNRHWQRTSVYEGLRERNIVLVNVDEPQLPGLPEPTNLVTADTGYVRFHGRNRENWWKGDNITRYDYCYSDTELREWVPRIQAMALQAAMIMVVFNNHSKGQAVQNVRRIREMMLQEQKER